MVNTRGFARLGMLAVGLGIGAMWAHTSVAAAASSTDWLTSIDGLFIVGLYPPRTHQSKASTELT